jgi:hypothetical protein
MLNYHSYSLFSLLHLLFWQLEVPNHGIPSLESCNNNLEQCFKIIQFKIKYEQKLRPRF